MGISPGTSRRAGRLLALGAVLAGSASFAEGETANLKVSIPILLKVLTYDQNFETRGFGEFVVVVASEAAQQSVRERLLDELKGLSVTAIKNRPIRFVGAEFRDGPSLDAAVQKVKAGAILAVPGLSGPGVSIVSDVGQDNQIYTLSLDAPMVEKALAVGVTQVGGRPQIVINDKASKALGVKFEASVLKLAKVIQ